MRGHLIRDRTWGWRQDIASWTEYYAGFFSFADFDLAVMKFSTRGGDVPTHGALIGARQGTIVGSAVKRRDGTGMIVDLDLKASTTAGGLRDHGAGASCAGRFSKQALSSAGIVGA